MSVASVGDWRSELGELHARLGALFIRSGLHRQAGLYREGLLSAVDRKNGWQLAEHPGDARPWRTRPVSSVRGEPLADREAVPSVDDIGFLKKGTKSAGVARQYSGTWAFEHRA